MSEAIKRILLSGGGTGGHIYPAIAIAKGFQEEYRDVDILFVGTEKGLEKEIIPHNGFKIKFIDAIYLYRKEKLNNLKVPFILLKSIIQAKRIIREFKPDVIIGTGGYVCAPVLVAGFLSGISTYIKEQDCHPGITTRLANLFVKKTFLAFPDSVKYLYRKKRCEVVGNPVRSNLIQYTKSEGIKILGLNENKKIIFVFGGSLGSKKINETIVAMLDIMDKKKYQILLQTGKYSFEHISNKVKQYSSDVIVVKRYIDNIAAAYSAADIVVSRAGAMTISELAYCSKTSILIPYPYATGNHQLFNAKYFSDNNAGFIIEEKDLSPSILYDKINFLISNKNILNKMNNNAHLLPIYLSSNELVKKIKK